MDEKLQILMLQIELIMKFNSLQQNPLYGNFIY